MIEDDDGADEHERAEAEALARALEGDASVAPEGGAPGDALEAATLLRAVAAREALASERARAVYSTLEPAMEHYVRPQRSRALGWAGASLAAAAAAALYFGGAEQPRQEAPSAAPRVELPPQSEAREPGLPAPARELLAAQAALGAQGASAEEQAAFERAMSAYRASVLQALKRAYPEQLGLLQPQRAR